MYISQAFREASFNLPKLNTSDSFPKLLREIYSGFLSTIDKVDEGTIVSKIKAQRSVLESFCNQIVESANTYYSGFPAKAYFQFEEAITLIDKFVFPDKAGRMAINEFEPYYRARYNSDEPLTKEEMFHIPFEKREYVATHRFSVPGLPCLYLANSVYGCWEELRKPDINKMQVSRLKLENYRLNFLNLSLSPNWWGTLPDETLYGENHSEKFNRNSESWDTINIIHLMRWPLLAACSIKVKYDDAPFKPEYIFPQFLLQWVTHSKKIDGIIYSSIEANFNSNAKFGSLVNYAIPVKQIRNSGLCNELVQSFSITEPVCFNLLKETNPDIMKLDLEKLEAATAKLAGGAMILFFEEDGKRDSYWNTVFGKIELEIAFMEFKKIML